LSVELLVIGVIRSGSNVLLVRQPGPDGPGTAWALPGGRPAPGELAVEALAREIKEETGLTINGVPELVCVGHMVNPTQIRLDDGEIPAAGGSAIILSYEVTSFEGSLDCSSDPDAGIAEVSWHSNDAAESLLAKHPFPFVREIARRSLPADDGHRPHVAQSYFRRALTGEDTSVILD
jgi:ADP-ribose pyrophosphatase YjhB (NUDIX family)